MPEDIQKIENALSQADEAPHPLLHDSIQFDFGNLSGGGGSAKTPQEIKDELPIEEQKRREAKAAGRAYRVPEWWQGEEQAYKTSKSAMVSVPKEIGK